MQNRTRIHPERGRQPLRGLVLLMTAVVAPLAACGSSSDSPVLKAPSSVAMVPDDGTVTLAWTDLAKAESYTLFYDTQPGLTKTTPNRIEGIATADFTVAGLQNGETYWFALVAVYRNGESKMSPEFSITLAPGAPASVTCTAGNGVVTMSWDDVYGAQTYNLYRSVLPGVSKHSGQLIADVTSPYDDATVVNGTTYYYVIEAVGTGGPSPDSLVFSATPRDPLGAPVGPSVALVEESPNTLEIAWGPPTLGVADSYNLYWDTSPGVTVGTNPIVGVSSPYVHAGLSGGTTYYYVVTAVQGGFESQPSAEVSGTPRGSPGGGGSGETGLGNNLSLPLVLANGYGIGGLAIDGTVAPWLDHATGLRPTSSEPLPSFPLFDPGTIHNLNGIDYYKQGSPSTWQAEWRDGSSAMQDVVMDWGDNLSSAHLTTSSAIRVEVVLYQDVASDPMSSYPMRILYGSGATEVQGTTGVAQPSNVRNVVALNARLRIEKLLGPGGAPDPSVAAFDSAVFENFAAEGPGGFATEINGAGALTYGYNWRLKNWPLTPPQRIGWWRLTFSLDPHATFGTPEVTLPGNVTLVALDPSETIATLDTSTNSSSIEIQLTQ